MKELKELIAEIKGISRERKYSVCSSPFPSTNKNPLRQSRCRGFLVPGNEAVNKVFVPYFDPRLRLFTYYAGKGT